MIDPVKIPNPYNYKESWLVKSLTRPNMFFIFRDWSSIEVEVSITNNYYKSYHRLEDFEREYIQEYLIKKEVA